MKRAEPDGVETCSDCQREVQVFDLGKRRAFMTHYKRYPEMCKGIPEQKEYDNENRKALDNNQR